MYMCVCVCVCVVCVQFDKKLLVHESGFHFNFTQLVLANNLLEGFFINTFKKTYVYF